MNTGQYLHHGGLSYKWLPDYLIFDGCLCEDETKLEDKYHKSFSFWDHMTIFICPVMFEHVKNEISICVLNF